MVLMLSTAVLLSGGVDSSVALGLLAKEGRRVRAYYLKIWLEDEVSYLGSCPWEEDLRYAQAVCDLFGVPLEVVPLQREYYERVVAYALEELRRGGTPSPDLLCNRLIKFGAFLERLGDSVDQVATGHYARLDRQGGATRLAMSPDPVKDQTYFLSRMTAQQLQRAEFPLGPFTKRQVRELARLWGLPNQDRPDSQGICFLGRIPYREFVRHYLGERPGPIVDVATGRLLGRHRGLWFYTVGQRSGLGLGGGPWYVWSKDEEENVLYVNHATDPRPRKRVRVGDLHWLGQAPESGYYRVKVRHGPRLYEATLRYATDLRQGSGSRAWVDLSQPDPGLAIGQFCVFYAGDQCLGSARIEGLG